MSDKDMDFSTDPFDKIEEVDEYSIEEDQEINTEKLILELKEKIVLLEKTNTDLRKKLESKTKKEALNSSIILKMSTTGLRRNFTLRKNVSVLKKDSVEVAEIIREKEDLQDNVEKLLDLVTQNQIENEDLTQQFENYKLEVELLKEKHYEQIENLKKKIDELEKKGVEKYDEIFDQYKDNKVQLQKQINDYNKLESELKKQIEFKDLKINKLNEEIQNLQFENLHLISKSEQQNQINVAGYMDLEKLTIEKNQIKSDLDKVTADLNKKNEELKNIENDKNKQMEQYEKEIQSLKNDINSKNDKIKQLNTEKTNLKSSNDQIYILFTNNKNALNEEKEKNFKIQSKLDKNTEELKSIKGFLQTLKTNNEKIIKEYEEKINELTKNKNDLISQNKELLEKLNPKKEESSGLSLDALVESEDKKSQDEISFYINENKLLNEEINNLKEQLSNQAHDLVEMNLLEKNIEKLKLENEDLTNNNKELSDKYNKLENAYNELLIKKNENNNSKVIDTFKQQEFNELKKMKAFRSVLDLSIKKSQKSFELKKEKKILKQKYEELKKLKEEQQKEYEKEIEKMTIDLSNVKAIFINKQLEDEVIIVKYKNMFNSIASQCKLKGIKLSFNPIKK